MTVTSNNQKSDCHHPDFAIFNMQSVMVAKIIQFIFFLSKWNNWKQATSSVGNYFWDRLQPRAVVSFEDILFGSKCLFWINQLWCDSEEHFDYSITFNTIFLFNQSIWMLCDFCSTQQVLLSIINYPINPGGLTNGDLH